MTNANPSRVPTVIAMASVLIIMSLVATDQRITAAQFPGQNTQTQQSKKLTDLKRKDSDKNPAPDDKRPLIKLPGEKGRIQLDRWTYAHEVGGVDPLTQVVRINGNNYSGSGFLLPNCRVITNLHVVAGIAKRRQLQAGESLVGQVFTYLSSPIPWFDSARAVGRIVILGHGAGGRFIDQTGWAKETPYPDQDWAVGYDLGCASERYRLGVVHLADETDGARLSQSPNIFAAGYTGFSMRGLSEYEFPLYVDSRCKILHATRFESQYETGCSMDPGGSGQPLLSGPLTDPRNPNILQTENGRPRVNAIGMFHAGGGHNPDAPNFYHQTYAVLFDASMRRQIQPFLDGPIRLDDIFHRKNPSEPEVLLYLRPRYTVDARRQKLEGEAVVRYRLNANGSVTNVSIVRGFDDGLDQLLLDAFREWVFLPVMREGRPIQSSWETTFRFFLD